MKKILILLTTIFINSLFAIISIAPVEIGDNAGVHTDAKVSLNTSRGSAEIDNYSTSLKVTYDNNISYVVWSEFSYKYGEVNGEENTNRTYLHLRYIQAITPKNLRAEFLLQRETDKFKLIDYRGLAGAGLRYKFPTEAKAYFGLGGFYENITYTSDDAEEKNVRLNTYLAYKLELEDGFTLSYTFYYQPKIDDFEDYVETNSFELNLPIREHLSLTINASYDIDSNPPIGVNRDNFSQTTSFIFSY